MFLYCCRLAAPEDVYKWSFNLLRGTPTPFRSLLCERLRCLLFILLLL
ncbi:hypothetical protein MITSMUL_04020 [Mitsuokella multacida DSM 20544]|uniref:Uncharacterized protein n=1 Tax=Mitsuokella multacida DSM 20544 TaxID=500635 RepID=C9KLB9_9FIRM|nr:hypothetical protein MITSMUL_04020 [Mitsuokella multacida DSM 20544]